MPEMFRYQIFKCRFLTNANVKIVSFPNELRCMFRIISTFARFFERDLCFSDTNIYKINFHKRQTTEITMKKKEYERPTMQVVVLKQRPQLLAGSDVNATLYNDGAFTEEDI